MIRTGIPAGLREVLAGWSPPAALAVVAAHELAYNHAGPGLWLLGQGLVWALVVRRRWPELVLVTTLVLAAACWTTHTLLVAHLGVLVALHAVARQVPRTRSLVAVVVVEAAAVVAALEFSPAGSVNDGIVLLTGITGAAYLLGTSQRATHHSLLELQRERELNAEMAAAAERTRIGREVHDVVAHSVSVMIALSEGAAATPDDDQARGSMRQVASTGRQALTELRGVLAVLQPDTDRSPTPSVASLEVLAGDVRDAGLDVGLDLQGDVGAMPPGLQATVYRLVQESLTNTLKHAPSATRSTVAVHVDGQEVSVVVRDDGARAALPVPATGGHGLRGMRERAEVYGGTATAGPTDDGWVVSCRIPLDGAAS